MIEATKKDIEAIKNVVAFAEPENKKEPSLQWEVVSFRPGEVYAQGRAGGARAEVSFDLKATVQAKRLIKALAAVRDESVSFTLKPSGLIIKDTMTGAQATLPVLGDDVGVEFARPDKAASWIPCHALCQAKRVAWAACKDESRENLRGISLSERGVEASNGYAVARVALPSAEHLFGDGIHVPVAMLKDLPNATWVTGGDNRVFLSEDMDGKNWRSCNLYTVKFPDLDPSFAAAKAIKPATIDRAAAIDLLKRARLSSKTLSLKFSGAKLTVNIDTQENDGDWGLFKFSDSIPIENGSDVTIGCSAEFLQPALEACEGERVSIRVGTELDPILITDGVYQALVMPCRL
jgi:hypothetical protein